MMTQLEKRLFDTSAMLLEDSSLQMTNLAGMLELLAKRIPGFSPAEQSLFLENSRYLLTLAEKRKTDAANLKAELPKLQGRGFRLN